MIIHWPNGPTFWMEDQTLYVSIPFTWNLPEVRTHLLQRSMLWDSAIVGGPAVLLMPEYLSGLTNVTIGDEMPGVLQRVNPMATRTTIGCIRRCAFCGIGQGRIDRVGFRELSDWPDLPIICDNNLMAASMRHLERVCERLRIWGWADFNQGLDARLLTYDKARLLGMIATPMVRLALDNLSDRWVWVKALEMLLGAGIAKKNIRSYCLIGFNTTPDEAWNRCEFVQSHGVKALPMWFHGLKQLHCNAVTQEQASHGWSNAHRTDIMGYYYKHRGEVPQGQRNNLA